MFSRRSRLANVRAAADIAADDAIVRSLMRGRAYRRDGGGGCLTLFRRSIVQADSTTGLKPNVPNSLASSAILATTTPSVKLMSRFSGRSSAADAARAVRFEATQKTKLRSLKKTGSASCRVANGHEGELWCVGVVVRLRFGMLLYSVNRMLEVRMRRQRALCLYLARTGCLLRLSRGFHAYS